MFAGLVQLSGVEKCPNPKPYTQNPKPYTLPKP
jgi:hypothetical protein